MNARLLVFRCFRSFGIPYVYCIEEFILQFLLLKKVIHRRNDVIVNIQMTHGSVSDIFNRGSSCLNVGLTTVHHLYTVV